MRAIKFDADKIFRILSQQECRKSHYGEFKKHFLVRRKTWFVFCACVHQKQCHLVPLYINMVQYTKGFFSLLVFFFYYFPSYLPCKNLNALSVTGVNTVQSFADMDVWWDSLQLCVFCFPVLC